MKVICDHCFKRIEGVMIRHDSMTGTYHRACWKEIIKETGF